MVGMLKWGSLQCGTDSNFLKIYLFLSIYLYLYLYIYFAVLNLRCCVGFFSSCSELVLHSSCDAQASHCGGFSY